MRVGLFARLGLGALVAALAAAGIVTATAGGTPPPGNPTFIEGSTEFKDCTSAAKAAGLSGTWTGVKADNAAVNGTYTGGGVSVTISGSNGKLFDWDSNNGPIGAVFVKAGAGAYLYQYPGGSMGADDLVGPGGKQISHVLFCKPELAKPLAVEKTAKTSWTRDWTWTVEKMATPASLDLVDGASGSVTWSIAASATPHDAYSVYGTITVTNPNGTPVAGVSVSDALAGAVADCDPGAQGAQNTGLTVPANSSITCSYSATVGSAASGTNIASATVAGYPNAGGSASAAFAFDKPTTEKHATVDVVDSNGTSWPGITAKDGLDTSYEQTLGCPGDKGQHDNTVEVREQQTGVKLASDTASVVVRCSARAVALVVTKTAGTSFTRAWRWSVDKSADPSSLQRENGQSGTTTWTVEVARSGPFDSNFQVSGTISVSNPNAAAVSGVSVTDALAGAVVDCDPSTQGAQNTGLTVPANGSIRCSYSASLDTKQNGTNTATATVAGKPELGDSGTADFVFGNPSEVVDAVVDVVDTNGRMWPDVSESSSFSYPQTLTCPGDEGTHSNTATVYGQDEALLDTDTASVELRCSEAPPNPPSPPSPPTPPAPPAPPAPPTPTADLSVTKVDTPDPVKVDGAITYAIRVTNAGPATAADVTLSDPAPTGVVFLTASPAVGTCETAAELVTCQLGPLGAGASVNVTVRARATKTGTVVNRVTVATETPESNGSNNTAEATTLVVGKAVPPQPKPKPKPKPTPKPEVCKTVGVSTKMVKANGQPQVISVTVTEGGKPKAGVRVLVNGAGIEKTARSARNGVARITVAPTKGGIVTVSVRNAKKCNTQRIGVVGTFEPPVTG